MNKTLIIGIGGTGLATIHQLRRLIAERYEQGLQAKEISSVKFVYIDTDDGDEKKLDWSFLNKDIKLTEGEKVIINGDRLDPIVENIGDYPEFAAWLPEIKEYTGEAGPGAKGIRPYGRLIYEYSENKRAVREKIIACYQSLNSSFSDIKEWRIYLVCGLSGGTGCGMFLPLSQDLKNWNIYQRGNADRKFYSFLILPSLQISGRHPRYYPNTYAALQEMNYQTFLPEPEKLPFNNCYLLEPRNADGLEITLEKLPLIVAQRIFLNIQGGEAASRIDSAMDNPGLGQVEEDEASGRRNSLRFSTLGLASVSYPKEFVAKCLSYRLGKQVISNWLLDGNYSKNINQQVRTELASIRLSISHIYGDADPYGRKDRGDRKNEIHTLVDEKINEIAKRKLGDETNRVVNAIEQNFRDLGLSEFYRQRLDDVSGSVDEALEQTRLKITSFLRDYNKGIVYAKSFLDELIKVIEEFKEEVNSKNNTNRVNLLQGNLSESLARIAREERDLLYGDKKFKIHRATLSLGIKKYLTSKADFEGSKYGNALISEILPQLRSLRGELDVWENRLIQARDKLSGYLKNITDSAEKGTQEHGKTIFNEQSLENIVRSVNSEVIQSSIEEIIKLKLGQSSLDLMVLSKLESVNPEDLVEQSSYEWVLDRNSPVQIESITLYDKFVDEISDPQMRKDILNSANQLSAPFLKFSPREVAKGGIEYDRQKVTTIPNGRGKISKSGEPTQAVIQSDLAAIGIPSENIQISEDRERILFLQELKAFPLRFIEVLDKLKKEYDNYPQKVVLHIDKNLQSQVSDLYLLSSNEKQSIAEAEEVWIIARTLGWIVLRLNQNTRKEQIRYDYKEPGKAGNQKKILGANWDETFINFVEDANLPHSKNQELREARQKLTDKKNNLYKNLLKNLDELDIFKAELEAYLERTALEYEAGIDDPQYEETQQIIDRIFESLN